MLRNITPPLQETSVGRSMSWKGSVFKKHGQTWCMTRAHIVFDKKHTGSEHYHIVHGLKKLFTHWICIDLVHIVQLPQDHV